MQICAQIIVQRLFALLLCSFLYKFFSTVRIYFLIAQSLCLMEKFILTSFFLCVGLPNTVIQLPQCSRSPLYLSAEICHSIKCFRWWRIIGDKKLYIYAYLDTANSLSCIRNDRKPLRIIRAEFQTNFSFQCLKKYKNQIFILL